MAKKKDTETAPEETAEKPAKPAKEATLEDELAAMNEEQRKSQEEYQDTGPNLPG